MSERLNRCPKCGAVQPEGVVSTMRDWAKSRPDTEAVDLTEIDPEGLVQIGGRGLGGNATVPIGSGPKPKVIEIVCDTLSEWVTSARSRLVSGHTLHPADDPKRLMLGFVDEQDNEQLLLPMRVLRQAEDSELEAVGVTREALATTTGRADLLSLNGFFLWQPGDSVHEPDPRLEAAWSHLFQERQD